MQRLFEVPCAQVLIVHVNTLVVYYCSAIVSITRNTHTCARTRTHAHGHVAWPCLMTPVRGGLSTTESVCGANVTGGQSLSVVLNLLEDRLEGGHGLWLRWRM